MKKQYIIIIVAVGILGCFILFFPLFTVSETSYDWELDKAIEDWHIKAYIADYKSDSGKTTATIVIQIVLDDWDTEIQEDIYPQNITINDISVKQNGKKIADMSSVTGALYGIGWGRVMKPLNKNETELFNMSGYIDLNRIFGYDDKELPREYVVSDNEQIYHVDTVYINLDNIEINKRRKIELSFNYDYVNQLDEKYNKDFVLTYNRKKFSFKINLIQALFFHLIDYILSR
jgi:hypothetical protein